MAAKIYRINYKSDFILTMNSDAGWAIPFCIKFFTSVPSRAYFVGFDGTTYTHCAYDPSEPTKLVVQFDDHHLPIGDLKYQIAYHFTVADFPDDTEDEVINPAAITTEIDGETYHVMLDFTGETAPKIEFNLPAYANEAERIENELQRQQQELQREQNETQRIENEEGRISAEQARQQTFDILESDVEGLESDVEGLKNDAQQAVDTANEASRTANAAAENADAKAQEAELASQRADNAAAQAVSIADTAATRAVGIANDAAARAENIANAAAKTATDAADNADAKAQEAEEAAEGANNVNATADGTVITVTNRQGESSSIDVNDVMLALIGINEILDEINGEVI